MISEGKNLSFSYQGRQVEVRALDSKVLVVAIEGEASDWSAYIGSVKGYDHEEEWLGAYHYGNKLSEKIARTIFPNEPWESLVWRD